MPLTIGCFALQIGMQMLGKDVGQLLAVHGLVPVDASLQVCGLPRVRQYIES